MAHFYKCTRCKAEGYNFDQHKCEGMRDLAEMDHDILFELATKKITEEDAWDLHDRAVALLEQTEAILKEKNVK